jgi:hypothetical protein
MSESVRSLLSKAKFSLSQALLTIDSLLVSLVLNRTSRDRDLYLSSLPFSKPWSGRGTDICDDPPRHSTHCSRVGFCLSNVLPGWCNPKQSSLRPLRPFPTKTRIMRRNLRTIRFPSFSFAQISCNA